MALVSKTRAILRREEDLRLAEEQYRAAMSIVAEGAPTVDQLKAKCRDAETAFSHYMQAIILLKEAQ